MERQLKYHFKIVFIGLLTVLTPLFLIGQEEKISVTKYGIEEGFPEEVAFSFLQDNQGFMWIGTQNGLVRYDGYKMKVFRYSDQDQNGLMLRHVSNHMFLSKDGKIWVGGQGLQGGIASFNPKTDRFTNYFPDVAETGSSFRTFCALLIEDVTGQIWFNYYTSIKNYLCRLDPESREIKYFPYAPRNIGNPIVLNFKMAESPGDSSLWTIAQNGDLMRYDRSKDTFEIKVMKDEIMPETNHKNTIQDITPAGKSGLIPMGNSKRLFLWDPLSQKVAHTFDFPYHRDTLWLGTAFEDHYGKIWVSSYENLTIIDLDSGKQERYTYGKEPFIFGKEYQYTQEIIPYFQDAEEIIFQVGHGRQAFPSFLKYHHSSGHFTFLDNRLNDPQNEIIENGNRKTIGKDRNGLLWFGNRPNLYKESPKLRQIKIYTHEAGNGTSLPSDTIAVLYEDSKQRLWIGTSRGLARMDQEGIFTPIHKGLHNKDADLGIVFTIFEDSKEQIWVGTQEGLFRCVENRDRAELILDGKNDNYLIASIIEDQNGNLWVSAFNRGLFLLDLQTGKIKRSFNRNNSDQSGLTSNRINKMFKDTKDRIWLSDPFANDQGLFRYLEEEDRFVHYAYDPKDAGSLSSNEIICVEEDSMGRIWVGTDNGLNLWDEEEDAFRKFDGILNQASFNHAIPSEGGKMWFTTYSGEGLVLVGPDINDVELFGEDKGLLHNDGGVFELDDQGNLWLPTSRGLSMFNTQDRTFKNFFKEDGYSSYNRNNKTYKRQNGEIWIGTLNGLNRVVPSKLAERDTTLPQVWITSIGIMDTVYSSPDSEILDRSVSYTDKIELKHWQKDLSFEFVALHYLRPRDNQYSWKLENYDQEWSLPSMERKASYTNLSPGSYSFKVRASNADGVWNEEGAALKILILPPWWQTWWAYGIYVLILILIGRRIHLYQQAKTLRLAREKAQAKELEQAREIEKAYAELKSTQAQLIQSEKMASLGELTAGIAHEIQNPLNFVNNFSEVSEEMIEEVNEEMEEGDLDEAKVILQDLKGNLKKISHHGHRASSIVKSMLDHSRAASGEKAESDINALCEEYLRLAYHGMRAKDREFNATIETNFDESLPRIKVVTQDVGRVLLNLINNAFQAVSEKSLTRLQALSGIVSVSTKSHGDKIEITVSDNGPGIPDDIKDKIFQPFFTTKPTGQGTGLGLSLSYDIIKAHGGNIELETKEGEGTRFVILLPVA